MKDMYSLEGKVATITGGSRGIGKGISQAFAAMGCDVVLMARNQERIDGAVNEITGEFGTKALRISLDIREEEAIIGMVQQVSKAFGRIDILVNNAGINIRKMPQDYQVSEWDEVLETNLRSPFLSSRAVYPYMRKVGGGKIINIGSMLSIFGGAKLAAYSASKGGIVQLTRSLAVAWAPDNIQVNAILPGFIDTDLTRQARKDINGLYEHVILRTPAGRWGEPRDLAGVAVFLASNASDFLTGVALPVDGGFSINL